jgi:hypothetical protein
VRKLLTTVVTDSLAHHAITDILGNTALPDHQSIPVSDQSHSIVTSSHSLSFDYSTGWIIAQHAANDYGQDITKLGWLPVELRGHDFYTRDSILVIPSELTHQLTIIDFEPMLTMLRRLGVVL